MNRHVTAGTGETSAYRRRRGTHVNIDEVERWASLVAGSLLAVYAVSRGGRVGLLTGAAGGMLIYSAARGHSTLYQTLGIEGEPSHVAPVMNLAHRRGVTVRRSIAINKPVEEVYTFWRNFENLPRFMRHLESVTCDGPRKSHWVARAPAGRRVAWDAEVIDEQPNARIAWRSLEDADVRNAGTVEFERAPGGRGTNIRVSLSYVPPGGKVGAVIAKLFGEEPGQQVHEDLRRLKQLLEAGEVPTVAGQPRGGA